MTGQANIIHTTLSPRERGLPENSLFEITLHDGTHISENDTNWSAISERRIVNYPYGKKGVLVCILPVKRIEVTIEGLHSFIDVPEGCGAYQAIRSESVVIPGYKRQDKVVGRILGIVKGDKIVEEHFLNALEYRVQGVRT